MCGLFGFVNFHEAAVGYVDAARTALHTLSHRGPDQWRDYVETNVYIGHRRLSILDLSENGRQPMISRDGQELHAEPSLLSRGAVTRVAGEVCPVWQ